MIPTISRYLYEIRRDRNWMELREARRKAFLLTLLIVLCVGLSTMIWIVYT